jgi:putative ABC transport system permease protein
LRYGGGHEHSFLRLGWRTLWRDLRAGELRLLIVAVTLAVAALTSVGFFADRLQGGLQRDARQLLGGDVVVVSDNPTPPAFAEQARALGLQSVTTLSFPTMGRASDAQGGASRLVALKAWRPATAARPAAGRPRPRRRQPTRDSGAGRGLGGCAAAGGAGPAWATPAAGRRQLRIARIIALEPDRGAGFMSFAPRVMINAADLPPPAWCSRPAASPTAWPWPARARPCRLHRLGRGRGEAPGVRGVRVESLDSGRPEMRQTLDRAEKFLNLVALLAALLSAVAVALAARGFAAATWTPAAMLRVLGLSQRALRGPMPRVRAGGPGASALGVALGWAVHHVFVAAGRLVRPPARGQPVAGGLGLGMGLTLLLAFGLPPVLQLAQVPPLRVMRRDWGRARLAGGAGPGRGRLCRAAAGGQPRPQAGPDRRGRLCRGRAAVCRPGLAGRAAAAPCVNEATAPRWLVLATRQIAARPAYAVVQVSSLAVGLLALVLLVLLRTDLIASWRQATPPDAPNRFVINIQPDQAEDFRALAGRRGATTGTP